MFSRQKEDDAQTACHGGNWPGWGHCQAPMAGYREHTGAAQGGPDQRALEPAKEPGLYQEGQKMRERGASLLGGRGRNDYAHVRAKQVLRKGPSLTGS